MLDDSLVYFTISIHYWCERVVLDDSLVYFAIAIHYWCERVLIDVQNAVEPVVMDIPDMKSLLRTFVNVLHDHKLCYETAKDDMLDSDILSELQKRLKNGCTNVFHYSLPCCTIQYHVSLFTNMFHYAGGVDTSASAGAQKSSKRIPTKKKNKSTKKGYTGIVIH